jgi:pyruvate-formate lyase-activating enzyme
MSLGRRRMVRRVHSALCALAHAERLTRTPIPPYEVFFEVTAHCNLRCVTCPQSGDLGRPKGHMDIGLFEELVEQVKPWASQASLFLAGEPLLYPHLDQALSLAHRAGLYTRIHTNALLLSQAKTDVLLAGHLDELSFSFDGPDAAHYDRIRVGGDFERCLDRVTAFLDEKGRRGLRRPRTIVQALSLRGDDEGQLLEANQRRLAGHDYDELKIVPTHSFAGHYKAHRRNAEQGEGGYNSCHMLYNRLTVLWDGRTVACCNDFQARYPTGDATRERLLDIWNNEPFQRLRDLLARGRYAEVDLCRHCDALWSGPGRRVPVLGAGMRLGARLAARRGR